VRHRDEGGAGGVNQFIETRCVDGDGIPDEDDPLERGDKRVINGETANAALVSGEVTVKLPGNRTEIALTGVSRIRQAHAQKELTRVVQIPVELSLVSAAGAESGRARGGKGVVRTLTAPARACSA
jgi:hypothetical protein